MFTVILAWINAKYNADYKILFACVFAMDAALFRWLYELIKLNMMDIILH